MKTPYRNIYDILKLNRIIVLVVCFLAFFSTCFSLWVAIGTNNKMLNKAFAVNTDGSVIPLKLVDQKENLEVEALSHLELFHRKFYGLNTSNYEKNIESALWLGDSTVDNIYRQKKAEGVYNRLLQYSLIQEIKEIKSELALSDSSWSFRTTTFFEVKRGTVTDKYELVTSGKLVRVDRSFPRNTHGLIITEFFENRLKLISDEN